MPDSIGSLIRRALVIGSIAIGAAAPATAQQTLGIVDAPDAATFLSRFDFNMSAAKLGHPDPRFSWDIHWAGDFDLVDYVHGRISFLADYQTLLGSEFRAFDPYQSNYTLEAMSSVRGRGTEFVGVLSHVSRHLGDRYKRIAVAENSLGLRTLQRLEFKGNQIDLRGDLRKVIARAYVDYNWFGALDIKGSRQLTPRAGVYLRLFGQLITVDPAIAARENQRGGRGELGIHVKGGGGSIDLFVGSERVVDADQLDRQPQTWAFAGFRLLGK